MEVLFRKDGDPLKEKTEIADFSAMVIPAQLVNANVLVGVKTNVELEHLATIECMHYTVNGLKIWVWAKEESILVKGC